MKAVYLVISPRQDIHRPQTSQAWYGFQAEKSSASQYDGNECQSLLKEESTANRQAVVCNVETTTLGKLG